MYRNKLNWYNWNEFLKYLLFNDINDLSELCVNYHFCGLIFCPHSPTLMKIGNEYTADIQIRYIIRTTRRRRLHYSLRKSIYTHKDWILGFVTHWREITRNRKRNRAARLIQEHVVRWLYNPHTEGPMFKKLKASIPLLRTT